MLKLTVALLAVVLAGTASAGWRSLRVDGRSEAGLTESLAAFKEKLPPARAHVFGEALKDIWAQGAKNAEADQREYTASDYYRQLDGLSYEQVVTFTDPTGDTADTRHKAAMAAYASMRRSPRNVAQSAAYAARRYAEQSAWDAAAYASQEPPRRDGPRGY